MPLSYQDTVRNTRLSDVITALGATAAIEIFTAAPQGKTAGTFNADAGTKLASLTMSNPVAPSPSGGVLTFSTITSATALASGTPGSFRIKTAAGGGVGTVIVEGSAGVGTGDLNFNSTIASGGAVSITSGTVTEGCP